MYNFYSINPATPNPVPIDTIRRHASIDYDYEDDLLGMYANAATSIIEQRLGRFIVQKQVQWTITASDRLDYGWYGNGNFYSAYLMGGYQMNRYIDLPQEAISIDGIQYGQWNGANAIVMNAGTDYFADVSTFPARVKMLTFVSDWETSNFQCLYTSGIAANASVVPLEIQQAIIMMTTRMKKYRGDEEDNVWSPAIESLIQSYVIYNFGSRNTFYGPGPF